MNLALQALKHDQQLSIRAAARVYDVAERTVRRRRAGHCARSDLAANSRNLTDSEEDTIVRYVLDMSARFFPPRLGGVEDMANRVLSARDAPRVGKNWASNFVRRRPELRTRFSRKYDYRRAKCEDPKVIGEWFRLVQETRARYGIVDDDVYNFDETGFMMGVISSTMVVTTSDRHSRASLAQPGNREWATVIQGVNARGWTIPPFVILKGQYHLANWYTECDLPGNWVLATTQNGWTTNERGVEWIKHFNHHTESRKVGTHRLLILDGHESHHSVEFELYCEKHKIVTLCMPPHASHLLQPLDVGCFGPLKQAYGRQVEDLMRDHVSHVSKVEFLRAFREAFVSAMTPVNVRAGFSKTGLVPHNPERVLVVLDVQVQTPSPVEKRSSAGRTWVSKTPQNTLEAASQSSLIKTRIASHQDSSPTPMFDAVDQFTKGTTAIMHEVTLLRAENSSLRKANDSLSKRRNAPKTRVRQGGSLSVKGAKVVLHQKSLHMSIQRDMRSSKVGSTATQQSLRRCRSCREPGHNSRTCPKVA